MKGLSIINGAQTVGAIAWELAANYDVLPTEVMATFICLDSAPEDFGDRVAQSRNRQNTIDPEDFAALYGRQIMLQREWEHDDYSLTVANLPMAETSP